VKDFYINEDFEIPPIALYHDTIIQCRDHIANIEKYETSLSFVSKSCNRLREQMVIGCFLIDRSHVVSKILPIPTNILEHIYLMMPSIGKRLSEAFYHVWTSPLFHCNSFSFAGSRCQRSNTKK
jgi:hypothetical protein